jgi:hypothetical protein
MDVKDGGIILISQARSGSTNLMKSIGSYYNKKQIFEPDLLKNEPKCNDKSDVVKFFPFWPSHFAKREMYYYDDILNKIKKYNTIILLSRRNKKEQVDSFYNVKEVIGGDYSSQWSNEEIDRDSLVYKFYYNYFIELDNIFNRLSNDLNLEINYYEDVFKNKKLNIDINLDLTFLEEKNKLRKPSNG